jgi:hypothetical protein
MQVFYIDEVYIIFLANKKKELDINKYGFRKNFRGGEDKNKKM